MSGFRTVGQLLVLSTALAMFAGCTKEEPINRVGVNVVEKGLFEGSWYMNRTVVDVQYEGAGMGTFPGDAASDLGGTGFAGVPRIRWVIDEHFLYAYRDYELVEGIDGAPREPGSFLGQPIAAFKIEKHFDIRREYNATTGEEQNVLAENDTDHRWYERQFMRVDWSENLLPGYYGITANLYEVFGLYTREPVPLYVQAASDFPDSWQPHFDYMPCANDADTSCQPYERDLAGDYAQGDLYHFSFVTQEMLSPGDVPDPLTGQTVNWCQSIYSDAPTCTAMIAYVRTSFLKVSDTRQYEPVNWTDSRWDRHGYFRNEGETADRQVGGIGDPFYGETDFLNYNINRHNIWKNWYTVNADGSHTPVPYTERDVRQIVWYTTTEMPAHLVQPSFDLVGQWNQVLMETVRELRHQEQPVYARQQCQTSNPDGYCFCQTDPNDGSSILPDTDGDGQGDCEGKYDSFESIEAQRARIVSGEPYDCHVVVNEDAEPDFNGTNLRDESFNGWFGYDAEGNEHGVPAHMEGSECVNVLRLNTCNRGSQLHNGGNFDGMNCEERGDSRFKFVSYVDQPGTDFLGITTFRADPVTGEIRFGDSNIGGPALDGYRTQALQQYDIQNGTYTEQELFTGEDVRGYFESLNQIQLPNRPRIDFNVALQNGTALPQEARAMNSHMDRLMSERLLRLRGEEGAANTYSSRLTNVVGTPLERRLVANTELLAAAGFDRLPEGMNLGNLPDAALDQVSPFRMSMGERLARFNDAEARLGHLGVHMPNEYVDNSIQWFVNKHTDWTRSHLEFSFNRLLFRQTEIHEMGHSLGLRHDFGGSADTNNYRDDYYYINARHPLPDPASFDIDGTNGLSSTEAANYEQAYTNARRVRELSGIDGAMNASIMDYAPAWYERVQGAGRYDHAAIAFGYGDVVELGDNSEGRNLAEVDVTNTPRDRFMYYSGGESCVVDSDCPFASDGERASELFPSNVAAGISQHCVSSIPGSGDPTMACSSFDQDVAAVNGSSASPRWVQPNFRFCSDERATGLSTAVGTEGWCNRYDEGDSYRETVRNIAESYDRMYIFSNFRRYRHAFNIGQYLLDQVIGRRFIVLQSIYQNLVYQYNSDPSFRTNTGPFGFYDQFLATADILNFYARVLTQPDVGTYRWNAQWNYYEKATIDPNRPGAQLNMPIGPGRYFNTIYQGGLSGIQRIERVGTFYDKIHTLMLMTGRGDGFGTATSYSHDFVPFFTNFYDIFPNEMQQIFKGMIRDSAVEYMPRVQCAPGSAFPNCVNPRIVYMDFYRGDCSDPSTCRPDPVSQNAALQVVNSPSNILLQIYATEFGLAQFPTFFDTSFQNQLFICVEGSGACQTPSPDAVEGVDYVRFTSDRFARSYLAWQVEPPPGQPEQASIGFEMIREARDTDFILRMLVKRRDGGVLSGAELAQLDDLNYIPPTAAADLALEINRLQGRLADLESFFSQLLELERTSGIAGVL